MNIEEGESPAREESRPARERREERERTIHAFAKGVGHDLGNILTPMVWVADSLAQTVGEDPQGREDLELLAIANSQAREILEDLMMLGGTASRGSSDILPAQLLADWSRSTSLESLRAEYPNRDILIQPDTGSTPIFGSEKTLLRLFYLLVRQGLIGAGDGGSARLALSPVILEEERLGYDRIPAGSYRVLELSHDGVPIPTEALDRVFEPFAWGRMQGKVGTGLGLAVARAITLSLGGGCDVGVSEGTSQYRCFLPE